VRHTRERCENQAPDRKNDTTTPILSEAFAA
jgi:hypothetical protein